MKKNPKMIIRLLLLLNVIPSVYSQSVVTSVIRYPFYSDKYAPNDRYGWYVGDSKFGNFTFNMTQLSLESSDGCKFDHVMILNGRDSSPVLGPWCGDISEQVNLTMSVLGYEFYVEFTSDASVESLGFTMRITEAPFSEKQLCEYMHDLQSRRISSYLAGGSDEYPRNLNCTWILHGSYNNQISLGFERLDIEFSGPDCFYDRFEIWDISEGDNSSSTGVLARLCGRQYPWTMATYTNQLEVRLISDRWDNTGGFVILYDLDAPLVMKRTIRHQSAVTPVLQSDAFLLQELDPSSRLLWKFRTHPGFAIRLHMPHLSSRAISLHDGPDTSFELLAVNEGDHTVSSKGFHLVAELDLSVDGTFIQHNVTFQTLNLLHGLNAHSGIINDSTRESHILHHLNYVRLTATPDALMNIILWFSFFSSSPNTDNCAYAGVALYDGAVHFDNLIGPFCDISTDYVMSVLGDMAPSTWILHMCFYDYSQQDNINYENAFSILPSNCSGHILTEKSFQQKQTFSAENVLMTVNGNTNQWNINITYTQSGSDCFRVQLLPDFTTSRNITLHVWLTGRFGYRICRRFGILESFEERHYFASKFQPFEECSSHWRAGEGTNDITEPLFTGNGWSMENVVLELGGYSSDCFEYSTCYHFALEQISFPCGIIYTSDFPGCEVRMILPDEMQNMDYYWYLKINVIYAEYLELSQIKICEEHKSLKTNISTLLFTAFKDVSNRPVHYYSMQNVELVIMPRALNVMNFEFDTVKLQSTISNIGETPTYEDCYLFDGHCYTFGQRSSWRSARNTCRQSGGDLVSVNTWPELQFLKTALSTVWFGQFYRNNRGLIFIGLHDMRKTNEYRWVDGSPPTVTDWYFPFDEDNILPHVPVPVINRRKIQPISDSSQRCVAMVPGNSHYSTNWRKVGCDVSTHPTPAYGICEFYDESSQKNHTLNVNIQNETSKYRCENGWNFVHNMCLSVLTKGIFLDGDFESGDVENMCNDIGGKLPKIDTIPRHLLKSFVISKGFSTALSDIWVRQPSGKVVCVALLGNRGHIAGLETCHLTTGVRWVALCEREPTEIVLQCPSYQFSCDDGTCLNPDRVCDTHSDCLDGEDESNCSIPYTFTCDSGQKISIFNYCDFHPDCPDGSDEASCIHPDCPEALPLHQCASGQCVLATQWCDHKVDCVDGSDEEECDWEQNCVGFRCPLAGCIADSQIEDLQADCPDKTEADEKVHPRDHKRGKVVIAENDFIPTYNFELDCPGHMDQIRCHRDHIKCFPADKSCVYDHDAYGQAKYCRNGAHLRHCEDFECPDMFKCPQSYCIPHHKVCDGVQDCVRGEDEYSCDDRKSCPGMLRCGSTAQCVSQENVCNSEINCKDNWADEKFCDFKYLACPQNCVCIGYYVKCEINKPEELSIIPISSRVLDLGNNSLILSNETVIDFPYLAFLYLHKNDIHFLPNAGFVHVPNLRVLDLSDNRIEIIQPDDFAGLHNLQTLNILGNPLRHISEFSFRGLSSLTALNLSGMMLEDLAPRCFAGLDSLKSLDVSNNRIHGLSADMFASVPPLDILLLDNNIIELTTTEALKNVDVRTLRMDSYRLCCVAGKSVGTCFPPADQFSSCADLIPNTIIRVVVWSFAVLAILGNGFVISWRLYKRLPDVPSVLILHLSISDLLTGLYLLSLSVADLHYTGIYILKDLEWRYSPYCIIIGVMGFVSCEMSMFTLVFIAVDRTKKLVFPFSGSQLSVSYVWKTECVGWIVCVLVSVLPLMLPLYFGDYYSRNSICLPFNFADPTGPGWEMTTVIFVGVNTIALVMIIVMYIVIFSSVKQAQKKAGRNDCIEVDVARKLSIVILTDVACLLPIILTNFMSILGHPINRTMASFLATLILPMNAAMNPFLFTFSNWKMAFTGKPLQFLSFRSNKSSTSKSE